MNFLITGAAGFLGSALANRLVVGGSGPRIWTICPPGSPHAASRCALHTGGCQRPPRLWTLLQDVDCVFHLAARVSVPKSVLYPREYNPVNVGGTVILMEAIRDVGVRRVVFISSGTVYGDQPDPTPGRMLPPHPRSPYAVSKLAAGCSVRSIGQYGALETVCLRVFNAYGPGQHLPASHPPVIPYLLRQALHGGSLVVHGDGTQTRDYVYVDDVVSARRPSRPRRGRTTSVINVGSGVEPPCASWSAWCSKPPVSGGGGL